MRAAGLLLVLERSRPKTAAHCWRVSELCEGVGGALALDERRLANLRLAALLHDVGKLKVPKEILCKPSSLTPAERALIKRHAELGAQLVCRLGVEPDVVRLVHHHHERLDGSGYPFGLGAARLDLETRILAACDVYDALASERSYAPAWPPEQALGHLRQNAGRLFDPRCVGALEEVLAADPAMLAAA